MAARKRTRGRPRKELEAQELEKQISTLSAVLNRAQLAEYFGMSEKSLERRLKEQPRFLTALKKGQAMAIANMGATLMLQAQRGNVAAAIFYLKARAGWKERMVVDDFDPDQFTDEQLADIAAGEPIDRIRAQAARDRRSA